MIVEEFLIANINGILITVIGWVYTKYPPKKINQLYGYRTRRSMANQEIWNVANILGAKMMLCLGISLLVFGSMLFSLYSNVNILMFTTFILLIGLGIGMFWCESQLNKRFDKNGNPKKPPS